MASKKVKQILSEKIEKGEWNLENSPAGKSKTSYIGVLGDRKVFIKINASQEALLRLSEIGITPKVLYSDIDILIQEFVEGSHPTADWVDANHKVFAQLIKKYHSDNKLLALLAKKEATDYANIFSKFILELEVWAKKTDVFVNDTQAQTHLKYLLDNIPKYISEKPVPIHADPNLTNIILSEDNLYIIDWDDIRLSDPLRDIGQFLYNFVGKENWNSFFEVYGLELNDERKQRIFWWVAALKLFVGLWFYLYQDDVDQYKRYLEDSKTVRKKHL